MLRLLHTIDGCCLQQFSEEWDQLTVDQKLDTMKAAPEFYNAASWLHAYYRIKGRGNGWLRQKQFRI